jgi:hypothetical protein
MATFFVNEGESIQAAINLSAAGDTIIVGAGTFNESININKDITVLSFDGADATIINGVGTSPGFSFSVMITAPGATFGDTDHGFTVNAAVGETAAVFVGPHANVHIEDNIINGNASATHLRQGLLAQAGVSNLLIEGNTFGGGATQLIYVNGAPDGGPASTNVDLLNNEFTGTAPVGAVLGSTGGDVTGNTFGGGITSAGLSLSVPGNTVTSNNFTGFVGTFDIVTADLVFDLNSNPTAENLSTSAFTAGDSDFFGNALANILRGANGFNDDLTGRAGNDTLLGRGGDDTANFTTSLAVGNIASVATDTDPITGGTQAGWQVNASGGGEGTDLLNDIEFVDGAEAGRFLLVGNGGFTTIQAAVNAANAGDTIVLAGGVTFTENVTVDEDVTIISAGTDAIIAGGLNITANNVTIDNVTIQGGTNVFAGEVVGIYVQGDNFAIQNSVLDGNGTTSVRGILTPRRRPGPRDRPRRLGQHHRGLDDGYLPEPRHGRLGERQHHREQHRRPRNRRSGCDHGRWQQLQQQHGRAHRRGHLRRHRKLVHANPGGQHVLGYGNGSARVCLWPEPGPWFAGHHRHRP